MKGLNKQICGNRMQLDRLATECHEHARKNLVMIAIFAEVATPYTSLLLL